jgi:hypothetical protein
MIPRQPKYQAPPNFQNTSLAPLAPSPENLVSIKAFPVPKHALADLNPDKPKRFWPNLKSRPFFETLNSP